MKRLRSVSYTHLDVYKRQELDFMHQALRQVDERELKVEDGWIYFVHGGSQVVAQVLHVDLTPEVFAALERAAATVR